MFRILAICFFVIIASLVLPKNAHADHNAYTTADVNMRTGPSVRNAIILAIPRGESVHVHGCLQNWSWCDVSWYGHRGYVYRRYLAEITAPPYRDYIYPPDYPGYIYPPRYVYPPYYRYERDWYGDRYHEPRKKRKKYKKKKKRHDGHKTKRKSQKKWKKGSNKKHWKKGGKKKRWKKGGKNKHGKRDHNKKHRKKRGGKTGQKR